MPTPQSGETHKRKLRPRYAKHNDQGKYFFQKKIFPKWNFLHNLEPGEKIQNQKGKNIYIYSASVLAWTLNVRCVLELGISHFRCSSFGLKMMVRSKASFEKCYVRNFNL